MLSLRHLDDSLYRQTTKTPGRKLKGRHVPLENTVFHGPQTGKKLVSQTPLGPKTVSKPTTAARPLVDKTPFQNRKRNSPAFNTPPQILKLGFGEPNDKLGTPNLQLPSSTRKHSRVPRSATRSLETPPNRGNHWDVSDIEIAAPEAQPIAEQNQTDDFDEIEYMPPHTVDLPYTPPFDFDFPDFRQLGKALLDVTHPYHVDDTEPQLDYVFDSASVVDCRLPLPRLDDDDPFKQLSKASLISARGSVPVKRSVSVPATARLTKGPLPHPSFASKKDNLPAQAPKLSRTPSISTLASIAERGNNPMPASNAIPRKPPRPQPISAHHPIPGTSSRRAAGLDNAHTTPAAMCKGVNGAAIEAKRMTARLSKTASTCTSEDKPIKREGNEFTSTTTTVRRATTSLSVHRPNSTAISSATTRRGRVGKSDDLIISFDAVSGSAGVLDDFQFDM